MTVDKPWWPQTPWYLLDVPVHADRRGNLFAVEAERIVPFVVKRVYWITQWPQGMKRGNHAHKQGEQVYFCLSGSVHFTMVKRGPNGITKEEIVLSDSHSADNHSGLYIGPMVWHSLCAQEEGSIILALASNYYTEEDYIRDYEEAVRGGGA